MQKYTYAYVINKNQIKVSDHKIQEVPLRKMSLYYNGQTIFCHVKVTKPLKR